MNEAEPDLGLGTVAEVDERTVVISFPAADETRRYAVRSAPLRRVRFAPGDTVTEASGEKFEVDDVEERDGILFYVCRDKEIPEFTLSDQISLGGPKARLLSGRTDPPALFELRAETLRRLSEVRRAPIRGFLGSRIELMPHQFFIASEVTGRRSPRVLLADETGLGKTIEACLIANRLLLTGRASRILILVPDSLVHQWLVELRRRFNLRFAIFDEERCAAAMSSDEDGEFEETNPFETEQLVLASIDLFSQDPDRAREAAESGWDLLIVDEAHHLEWSPGNASPEYEAVETIATAADGLLLLTATPEQLGEHGHFARLRLLDPDRYADFEDWHDEAESFRTVARVSARLLEHDDLSDEDCETIAEVLAASELSIRERSADPDGRSEIFDELTDRHGPGRVIFRNTRHAMQGFPERRVHMHVLASESDSRETRNELAADLGRATEGPTLDFSKDPRIEWLLSRMTGKSAAKTLVLCTSAAKVLAIKDAIDRRTKLDVALFHEGLSVLQRDRNAAWFADPNGANLLVCSEIGSEGRNFQHARDLVMFDLPLDPDLVEQRIGRLDRIGRSGAVHIHVSYIENTGAEALARWHHEGIGVFEHPVAVGRPLLEEFGRRVADSACGVETNREARKEILNALVRETADARDRLAESLEAGRDRLLEMASLKHDVAERIIGEVRARDDDTEIDEFFLRLLEHFHVYAEQIGERSYHLNPDTMRSAEFPSLAEGTTAGTFDRDTALVREDLEYLSWDHPLLGDAMELLQSTEVGNACFAVSSVGSPGLFLESLFVLESVAPRRLHVDRFLPPTPLRAASDQRAVAVETPDPSDAVEPGDPDWIVGHQGVLRDAITKMETTNETTAERLATAIRKRAVERMREVLGAELDRLRYLAGVNDAVRPQELLDAEREIEDLQSYIERARIRLDACRLIWRGPSDRGVPSL
jgi:ATP-dependent helicase HepA